jgi:hypothetical protein
LKASGPNAPRRWAKLKEGVSMDDFGPVSYRGIVEGGTEPETRDFRTLAEARRWAEALGKERECPWHVLAVGTDGRLLVEAPPELTGVAS